MAVVRQGVRDVLVTLGVSYDRLQAAAEATD
jgi:hypothetical protein